MEAAQALAVSLFTSSPFPLVNVISAQPTASAGMVSRAVKNVTVTHALGESIMGLSQYSIFVFGPVPDYAEPLVCEKANAAAVGWPFGLSRVSA